MTEDQKEAIGSLPPRQLEVLRLVAQHLSTKEIAKALALSPHTVEAHIAALRRRLGGLARAEAGRLLAAWQASGTLASDPGHQSAGMAVPTPPGQPVRTKQHNAYTAMLAVAARAILDAIYVSVFFLVMSAVAYGSHLLVEAAKARHVDSMVVGILHTVEIILVAVDGIGVVSASVILTYRFVTALIRADSPHHAGKR